MNKEIKNPNHLLNKVSGVLVIDLLTYASRITDDEILNSFIDPPKGLYQKGVLKPILDSKELYFLESNFKKGKFIKDFNLVINSNENILDIKGNIVLYAEVIKKKKKVLTTESTMPIIAIEIAFVLVSNYLDVLCPYARIVKKNRIENLIRPECCDLIYDDIIDLEYQDLIEEVFEFVNGDTWHIYFIRQIGTSIVIEKTIDWRIYKYHKDEYDEYLNSNQSDDESFDATNDFIIREFKKR